MFNLNMTKYRQIIDAKNVILSEHNIVLYPTKRRMINMLILYAICICQNRKFIHCNIHTMKIMLEWDVKCDSTSMTYRYWKCSYHEWYNGYKFCSMACKYGLLKWNFMIFDKNNKDPLKTLIIQKFSC